jgi:hypothetical protein
MPRPNDPDDECDLPRCVVERPKKPKRKARGTCLLDIRPDLRADMERDLMFAPHAVAHSTESRRTTPDDFWVMK